MKCCPCCTKEGTAGSVAVVVILGCGAYGAANAASVIATVETVLWSVFGAVSAFVLVMLVAIVRRVLGYAGLDYSGRHSRGVLRSVRRGIRGNVQSLSDTAGETGRKAITAATQQGIPGTVRVPGQVVRGKDND